MTELPTDLQHANGYARRERIRSWTLPDDRRLTLDVIELTNGRKFEVRAEWKTRDDDGQVLKIDQLWWDDYTSANTVAEAAADALYTRTFEGLTPLAARLGLSPIP